MGAEGKDRAQTLKNIGNGHYADRNFQAAIVAYSQAVDLDPSNHMLYSNRSACYLQMKDFEKATQDARLLTRMMPAFAKGWGRLGASLFAAGQYEEAAPAYSKAAELDPASKDYAEQARIAKDKASRGEGVAGEDTRKQFYIEKHKRQGLEEFQKKNFHSAVRYFTQALEVDPLSHIILSNRSAAYCRVAEMPSTPFRDMPDIYQQALEDALKCTKLNPTWAKGYARKGAALKGLGRHEEAKVAFEEGLVQDSGDKYCKEGLEDIKAVVLDKALAEEEFKKQAELNKEADAVVAANPDQAPLPDTKIPQVFCHKCGKEGHFATNCREKIVQGVAGGGYAHGYETCRYCGEVGHNRKNCPARLGKIEATQYLKETGQHRASDGPDHKRARQG